MPVILPAGNNENAHFNWSGPGWGSDPVGGRLTEIMSNEIQLTPAYKKT